MVQSKIVTILTIWSIVCVGLCGIIAVFPDKDIYVSARTINVSKDGSADYTSIQTAVNNAQDGDTIFVHSGTYTEGITISKAVRLVGEDRWTTMIDGSGNGKVIQITGSGASVSNLTIMGAGSGTPNYVYDSGVLVVANRVTVNGCVFKRIPKVPIMVSENADYLLVENNTFTGSYVNAIRMTGHTFNNAMFFNNDFLGDSYGIVVYTAYTMENMQIKGNRFYGSAWSGVSFTMGGSAPSEGMIISNNIIRGFAIGLSLGQIDKALIYGNTIENNDVGLSSGYTLNTNSQIFLNNFINNTKQVSSGTQITWDKGYSVGGNYWSDYKGTNVMSGPGQNITGADGYGDTPYTNSAGVVDHYPFMEPLDMDNITDFTPPTIVSTSPVNGAVDVSIKVRVMLEFSRPMDAASTRSAILIKPKVKFDIIWSQDGKNLTIKFQKPLEYFTEYQVTIETVAFDRNGTSLLRPYTFEFRTVSKTLADFRDSILIFIAIILIAVVSMALVMYLLTRK